MKQENLFGTENEKKDSGPVECLGMTFESDEARRTHFTDLLRDKLKDPEFRAIEGFPIGSDESILEISNPPFYTACPNPWLSDFIAQWKHDHVSQLVSEPYASDVKEGKNDPIYNAHSYHTKVPYKAIMRYLLHYTEPGDIILDGFSGSGMTGVAANMCGNVMEIESLGYQVTGNKYIQEEKDGEIVEFSKVGRRKVILNDLAPAASFMSSVFNGKVNIEKLKNEYKTFMSLLSKDISHLWDTKHDDSLSGQVKYAVWSDVYECPECNNEFVYYDRVFRNEGKNVSFNPDFNCEHCNVKLSKNPKKGSGAIKPLRVYIQEYDHILNEVVKVQKRKIVNINYVVGKTRLTKEQDSLDDEKYGQISLENVREYIPNQKIIEGEKSSDPFSNNIKYVHQFYSRRMLYSLGMMKKHCGTSRELQFLMGSILPKMTKMNRYMPQHGGRALVGPMANTLYIPPVSVENNPLEQLEFQFKKIVQSLELREGVVISTQATQTIDIEKNSVDYIFIDPPFGANIMYSELSLIREAWLGVVTNNLLEAIENKYQHKDVNVYRHLMLECFKKAYHVLKPGKWMTVEFSNTKAAVWNSIQSSLMEAGFVVANVSALNKSRGGLHSMLGATAVKQDLIITAYKPDGSDNENVNANQKSLSVWDFIENHLNKLSKVKLQGGYLQKIPERDMRILYDQVVSYCVRNNIEITYSSLGFQREIQERFIIRDDMVFLSSQVGEYDKYRAKYNIESQISLFVDDEASAIEWMRQELKTKPKTYSEIHPLFLNELSGWKKNELELELSTLLEQNFIKYDGKDEVPSQIHTYLSTNFKDMRGLDKSDPKLVAKAKDRWYVPDPNKAADLEKVRLRALLKEFEMYKAEKKKIKQPRAEALRAGFNTAWEAQDFQTILDISAKIPPAVLQEDEKLLMFYDNALTLTSTEDDEW
ncbi:TPA: DNA methylase [Vibrio harveyi]|nr:DNA methylase [Vibrio harveyi]